MKYTLLDMTQDILSSMDSDEVNSITDNTEALQVARVIRACYFDILNTNLPEDTTIYHLESSQDSTMPVVMYRPDDVHNLMLLKYNKATLDAPDPLYTTLIPLSIQEFFDLTHRLSLSEDNVSSMTAIFAGDSVDLLHQTDRGPTYYTSPDDHTFLFDSYDSEVDTILQSSKTFCVGEKEKTFLFEDDYEIDLDEQQHVWLLNEAKALAFQELKQMVNQRAEQTAKRQRIKAQYQKFVTNDPWVNYRQSMGYGRNAPRTTSNLIMH